MNPYTYVWEFEVRPGREADFELGYGPNGSWVRLFSSGRGYLGTVLLRDLSRAGRYVTIDRWESEQAYREFRQTHAAEFAALDAEGEALTVAEREIGRFTPVAGDAIEAPPAERAEKRRT